MLETTHAFAVGGKANSGKTFITLTAPKPVAVIYSDRPGGDVDLRGMEDMGIYLYKVDPSNFRDSIKQKMAEVRRDIVAKKLKTVIWDSISMGQAQQTQKVSGGNRAGMSIKSHGTVSMNIMDVLDELFSLVGVHRGVTFHIKEETVYNDKKEVIGTIWKPQVMPGVAKMLTNYCALIGYTCKRPKADRSGNDYSTCFLEQMKGKVGTMKFDCAKSPEGWGDNEPSDISAWFRHIESDAETRKAIIRAAAMNGVSAPPPPADEAVATESNEGESKPSADVPE